jgi:alanyl-tRNA synthetase
VKSSEIRKTFIDYFVERGHEAVRSSSLIPQSDPTLLFTNAGMVQFKSVFLGHETRPYRRAVSCQKSLRAGGKHSDLENVGHTSRHHTFFEMLGNFSFGDYFKREAIAFAWELLTKYYGLPEERLWATIYEDDDEAAALWQEVSGLPADRVVRLGAKDNFWQMADTGPCGPCSEIIIDQGEELGCGRPDCRVGCECDRYLELWNLVFMQFNRDEQGRLSPLPSPSIDTGMGLERLCAVLEGKKNNFDTGLFREIIESISLHTGVQYGKGPETDASIRVMADHVRASGFLLSDGLMPSNEGRGYVLRRIVRRASRHARLLGTEEPVLYRVLDAVVSSMGGAYPELIEERDRASRVLHTEEERFSRTLRQGMRMLDELLDGMKASGEKVIPGGEVFKLYDTFGFPVDLVRDIAVDSGLAVDEEGFHSAMEVQRERARASWVGEDEAVSAVYREVLSEVGKTEFIGYETTESDSVVRSIIKGGRVVDELSEGEKAELILDKTPFYGESGGQVGDTGVMVSEGARLEVLDTKKPLEGMHSHIVRVKKGTLKVWDRLRCRVDREKRGAIMRNHTATHILQAALRLVLGEHVKQAGSLVEPGRLRFDFTHFSRVSPEELASVEEAVNERILDNIPLEVTESDMEAALDSGAVALFGEKYGERVRIVGVPGFSRELCGGTHVRATGDIGLFLIDSEGSVASGIRRIEALTGMGAFRRIKDDEGELREIGSMLKTSERPSGRVGALLKELRDLQRENEKLRGASMKDASMDIVKAARTVAGLKVISRRVDGLSQKELRDLADKVRDRLGSGIIVLASALDGQASFLAVVTRDLTGRFRAGEILRSVASASGGRGGGKPDMAQGGTRELDKLDSALESVYDIVREGGAS